VSFVTAYLTPRETSIWDLRRNNKNQAEIGRLLSITRQASHQRLSMIDEKIERAFTEAATSNDLEIRSMNLVDGIMEAYSPIHNVPVFVSLSRANGLKVWYLHEGNCSSCTHEKNCIKFLEAEISERGIELTKEDRSLPPTQLTLKIFSKYLGGSKVV
jgi:hypothetical protein